MLVEVQVHSSQFPEAIRTALFESLRTRQINPKFHYDSHKQARKWLRVHQACAPLERDPATQTAYDACFAAAAAAAQGRPLHVISLGCGSGHKDARLLQSCRARTGPLVYSPVDASLPLTLLAYQAALPWVDAARPLVCDLLAAPDLGEKRRYLGSTSSRRAHDGFWNFRA